MHARAGYLYSSSSPPVVPDRLQLPPFFLWGVTGKHGTLTEATAFLSQCLCLYSINRWEVLAVLRPQLNSFWLEDLLFLFMADCCCVGMFILPGIWCLIKKNWKLLSPPLLMITKIKVDVLYNRFHTKCWATHNGNCSFCGWFIGFLLF